MGIDTNISINYLIRDSEIEVFKTSQRVMSIFAKIVFREIDVYSKFFLSIIDTTRQPQQRCDTIAIDVVNSLYFEAVISDKLHSL